MFVVLLPIQWERRFPLLGIVRNRVDKGMLDEILLQEEIVAVLLLLLLLLLAFVIFEKE